MVATDSLPAEPDSKVERVETRQSRSAKGKYVLLEFRPSHRLLNFATAGLTTDHLIN